MALMASGIGSADTPVELLKRARSGDRIAMRQIGHRLIRGDGVPREVSSGIGWLEKAADEGDDVAMLMLGDIYRNGIGVPKNMRKAIRYYEKAEEAGNEVAVKRLKKYGPDADEASVAAKDSRTRESKDAGGRHREERGMNGRNPAESASEEDLEKAMEERDEALSAPQMAARMELKKRGIPEKLYAAKALEAVSRDDLTVLMLLLEAGVDPNIDSQAGVSPLHKAAELGRVRMIQPLIKAGADVNKPDDEGMTPLHYAVDSGRSDACRALMAAGADLNAVARGCGAPLHIAVLKGDVELVRRLLTAGADANVVSKEGETPLLRAVACGIMPIVQVLIGGGADVNYKIIGQRTVLDVAAGDKNWTLYKYLRQSGAK